MDRQQEQLEKFPQKLKQLRQGRGWSQGQLGKKLGVTLQLISKYERGAVSPPSKIMVRIADTFDISLDYLMRKDAERASSKIKNEALLQRIEEIDALPDEYQDALVLLLDAFIKKHRFEQLAHSS